ncbi:MAG TPA: hypothetical protein VMV14_09550 [Acidimicrobiales bacterium]|nr:hypothetical protein [Acidimicrobiales bacterium]
MIPAPADPYASTPLAQKLGIRPDTVLSLLGAPRQWAVPDLSPGVAVRRRLSADTAVAILFVRRAAGHRSDITDEVVRGEVLSSGWVDVKVAAIGEDWSGLRFVRRRRER